MDTTTREPIKFLYLLISTTTLGISEFKKEAGRFYRSIILLNQAKTEKNDFIYSIKMLHSYLINVVFCIAVRAFPYPNILLQFFSFEAKGNKKTMKKLKKELLQSTKTAPL